MRAVARRTSRVKPARYDQSIGTSKSWRRPAKYSSSSRRTGSSRAGASSTRGDTRAASSSKAASCSPKPTRIRPASVAARNSSPTGESVVVQATSTRPSAAAACRTRSSTAAGGPDPSPARRATSGSEVMAELLGELGAEGREAGADVLAGGRLAAVEDHGDLGVGEVGDVAVQHRGLLLGRQAADRVPEVLVDRLGLHRDGLDPRPVDLVAAGHPPVMVDRLVVGDGEEPAL